MCAEGEMKALRRIWLVGVGVVVSVMPSVAAQARPYTLFYMDGSQAAKTSFAAHAAKIDVLVPTWYTVDADGLVGGGPDEPVMQVARRNGVEVMPIVALFDMKAFHRLATNSAAQAEMNAAMVRESKAHGYSGFQFDFEHIAWTDRDLLSEMVARSADAMHKAGLKLTIATVPNAPGYVTSKDGRDGFEAWMFREWRGAYDLAALSKSADLICLMTYDQHTRWTMPGPVAGWRWTQENLEYALKVVPKEKLLLGIPLYGAHWYARAPTVTDTSETPNEGGDEISTAAVMALAAALAEAPQWTEQAWRAVLAGGGRVMLVAETEQGIAGFCVAQVVMDTAELESIAVERTEQRRGVGGRLLAAAMEACAAAGARRMLLEVRVSNEAARRLYARAGFVESGRRRGYYREPVEDAVGMECALGAG